MYNFSPISELPRRGQYYERDDGIGFDANWYPRVPPRKFQGRTPLYETSTTYFITKTITYDNKDIFHRDVENLERLKEETWERIKVPEFTFEYKDNVLQYTSQFIKGWGCNLKRMDYIYDEIVCRDSEYSFVDYDPSNFIRTYQGEVDSLERYGGSAYAIDLNSYRKMDRSDRIHLWNRQRARWSHPRLP